MSQMGMDKLRTIGLVRAHQHNALSNLVYNMDRYAFLCRFTRSRQSGRGRGTAMLRGAGEQAYEPEKFDGCVEKHHQGTVAWYHQSKRCNFSINAPSGSSRFLVVVSKIGRIASRA